MEYKNGKNGIFFSFQQSYLEMEITFSSWTLSPQPFFRTGFHHKLLLLYLFAAALVCPYQGSIVSSTPSTQPPCRKNQGLLHARREEKQELMEIRQREEKRTYDPR